MIILKQHVNSSSNFASLFTAPIHKSSVNFKIIHFFILDERIPSKSQFWDFSSVLVFLRISHQSSVSWDLIFYTFLAEILELSTKEAFQSINLVKFHVRILHFDEFLLSKSYRVSAKSTEELSFMILRSDAKFNKNWPVVSNMTPGIWWIFTQPIQNLKISLW